MFWSLKFKHQKDERRRLPPTSCFNSLLFPCLVHSRQQLQSWSVLTAARTHFLWRASNNEFEPFEVTRGESCAPLNKENYGCIWHGMVIFALTCQLFYLFDLWYWSMFSNILCTRRPSPILLQLILRLTIKICAHPQAKQGRETACFPQGVFDTKSTSTILSSPLNSTPVSTSPRIISRFFHASNLVHLKSIEFTPDSLYPLNSDTPPILAVLK